MSYCFCEAPNFFFQLHLYYSSLVTFQTTKIFVSFKHMFLITKQLHTRQHFSVNHAIKIPSLSLSLKCIKYLSKN